MILQWIIMQAYFTIKNCKAICKKIDGDNKIFVDTSSMYFGSNNAFSNYK